MISKDPKSAEVIRPILRGRDIKKYAIDFQDKYLITTFPSKSLHIDDYPAVKEWLENGDWVKIKTKGNPPTPVGSGKLRLEQAGSQYEFAGVKFKSRKKTGNKWFEIQDSIGYWEDFYSQKIIYPNMTKYLPFYFDNYNYMTNQKAFIITGNHLATLLAFLNSSLFKFVYVDSFPELQGGTRELSKVFFEKIYIKQLSEAEDLKFKEFILAIQKLKEDGKDSSNLEYQLDNMVFELYSISDEERKIIEETVSPLNI
ncbi:TaqI-like C-terminal specificity domain-containing protein [Aerococcus urinaeequi]|uniref:TaqI-like C-terminal specificity domain-containing protein n=1 Tax=Aerococcus urinaeequi TaxID=51665 RepID=UPI003AAF645A